MTSTRHRLLRWIMVVAVLSGFAVAWIITDARSGRVTMYSHARYFLLFLGFLLALTIVRVLLAPEIRSLLDWVVAIIRSLGTRPVRMLRAISLGAALIGLLAAIVLSVLALYSPWLGRVWPIPAAMVAGFVGFGCFMLTALAARNASKP